MISLALLSIPNIHARSPAKQSFWHCDRNWITSSNASSFFRRLETTTPKTQKTGRGSGRLSLFQKQPTKNGSDHATSEPLFISTARFDLLVPYPLTLLLIGRQQFLTKISFANLS